jgi:putative inorganic carbon (HCO3(-)) transporter
MSSHKPNRIYYHIIKLIKMILVPISGIVVGIILYEIITPNIAFYTIGMLLIVVMLPIILRYSEYFEKVFIAMLLLTLPLIIDKTFNIAEHEGGARGFVLSLHNLLIIILIFLWLYRMILFKERKIQFFKKYSIPLIGIFLMCVLSMVQAVDRSFSIYEFVEIIKKYLIFLYIANYLAETKNVRLIIYFLLFGLFLENIFVFIEVALRHPLNITAIGTRITNNFNPLKSSFYRASGTLGGANGLAWYLGCVLPIPLALLFSKMKKKYKISVLILFVLGLLSLVFTYSRGGWIGFIIGAIIVSLIYFRKLKSIRKMAFLIMIIFLVGIGTTLMLYTSNPIKDRIVGDDRGSAYSRLLLMEVAIEMIKHNPLIGVGLNNYTIVDQEYDFGVDKITDYYPVPVHNFYLQLAAEIGIISLLLLLWFITYLYIRSIHFIKTNQGLSVALLIGCLGGMTAFLINGLVENSSLGHHYLLPFWIFSGIIIGIIEMGAFTELS